MFRRRLLACATAAILMSGSSLLAHDTSRPCGPAAMKGPLRFLIPQGVCGADFRPACHQHDDCYDEPGVNKDRCDRRFLRDMECACSQSKHPRLCRFVARVMYRATKKRGSLAFRSAQRLATATFP